MIIIKIIIAEKLKGPPPSPIGQKIRTSCVTQYMSCVELQGEEVPSFHLLVRDRSPSLYHLHRALRRPAHRNEYHLKNTYINNGFFSNTSQSIFADFLLHAFCGLNIWLRVWRGFPNQSQRKVKETIEIPGYLRHFDKWLSCQE